VTMDCDLHPEGQRCRVGYLSRRISHDTFKVTNYVHRTAVVVMISTMFERMPSQEFAGRRCKHVNITIIIGFKCAVLNTLYSCFINFEPANQIFNGSTH
jgi:hypothetical protein